MRKTLENQLPSNTVVSRNAPFTARRWRRGRDGDAKEEGNEVEDTDQKPEGAEAEEASPGGDPENTDAPEDKKDDEETGAADTEGGDDKADAAADPVEGDGETDTKDEATKENAKEENEEAKPVKAAAKPKEHVNVPKSVDTHQHPKEAAHHLNKDKNLGKDKPHGKKTSSRKPVTTEVIKKNHSIRNITAAIIRRKKKIEEIEKIQETWKWNVAELLAREDLGLVGSYGGGDHIAGQKTSHFPVIFVHGMFTSAGTTQPMSAFFQSSGGYSEEELYATTFGPRGSLVISGAMDCQYSQTVV
uniref:Uncharacterized protein n=1 Tax=Ditylenchus dipsaci TaxID=166011 RepID=A0A915EUF3_9BILA